MGFASNAAAQTAPGLGAAASYAVLGGQTVTNTGPTTINGDLGVSPGTSVTNFPPGIVTGGTIHAADANALQAQGAVTTAYNALAAEPCTADLTGQDLGGMTLTEGVYCFSSSAQLTGLLTLNAQGSASAVFVFKIVSMLTTASNSSVLVTNGSTGCNVFWQVGSSATIRDGHRIRGQYPGPDEHLPDHRRKRVRQGPGAKRCGDDGYEPRRLLRLRRIYDQRFPNGFTNHLGYRDVITNSHPRSIRDSYADGNSRGADAHTYGHAGWPDANVDSYSHAGWADAHAPHHALLPAAHRRFFFAG